MTNPRLKDLQFLNDMIGKKVCGDTKFKNGIIVKNHKHALSLFEDQQKLYRIGTVLNFYKK